MKPLFQLLEQRKESQHTDVQSIDFEHMMLSQVEAKSKIVPWMKDLKQNNSNHFISLENEIVCFYNWAKLNESELTSRKALVATLFKKATEVLGHPPVQFKLYGSVPSGTSLYFGDIDVSIGDFQGKEKLLNDFTKRLSDDVGPTQYISSARVPVLRGTELFTKIEFDVSFDVQLRNPLKLSQDEIVLLIIMKHFLKNRQLDSPRYGGLSGFQLSVLIVGFYANRESIFGRMLNQYPHATHLLQFLEFMVRFNSYKISFAVNDKQNKVVLQRRDRTYQSENLYIYWEDQNEDNLSGGVFNFRQIQLSCEMAYLNLQRVSETLGSSIIGRIIQPFEHGMKMRELALEKEINKASE